MPPFSPSPPGVTNATDYTREMVRVTAATGSVWTEIARFALAKNCAFHLVLNIVGRSVASNDLAAFCVSVTGRCLGGAASILDLRAFQAANSIFDGDYRVKESGSEIIVSVKSLDDSAWTCALTDVEGITP